MMWALYFIAFSLLVLPVVIILSVNATIKKPGELKIYPKELIDEFQQFEEMLKSAKRVVIEDKECKIDDKDKRYFYVDNKRMELNIDNYINHVIG